jgi:uncharacterized protein (DUF1330 family)
MAKGYWVGCFRRVIDEDKVAAYRALAGPAITAAGGRFIARGMPAKFYDSGIMERTVIVEFESVNAAIAAHDSPAYQKALAALDGGVEREIRIVEGVD